jgi:septum formation protein
VTAVGLVLASASRTRQQLLGAAGVAFDVDPASIDEAGVRESLRSAGASSAAAAETLAELKATRVSQRQPDRLVLGADQILELGGAWLDKPTDRAEARAQLMALRGRSHELVCCQCVVRNGARLWHHHDRARLTMRAFSESFLEAYLSAAGADLVEAVGAYRLEGRGVQLFDRIEGEFFTILGLPLLPLLGFLREHGVVAS